MAETPRDSRFGPPRDDSKDGPAAHANDPVDNSKGGPAYADVPALAMIWGSAPPITTYLPNSGGSGGGDHQTAGSHAPINVNIGSIVDGMQGMLDASKSAVDGYTLMEQVVVGAMFSGNTFGEQATYQDDWGKSDGSAVHSKQRAQGVSPDYASHSDHPGQHPDTEVQSAAKAYAEAMYPKMTEVLKECANAIELAGQFIVRMDRAGTYYANADHASAFPESMKPVVGT
ncbi:hypothetical protein [Streptomyces pinistramenti]|uniref:hypothetical protein n=1 Tax=Streptomyces pinistramenti TaxID=2884812 RepID=UPI001D08FBDA|nr:hypothetical protein [Streptomyces pinistramenti]MCB5906949.1 hypothetical protein [Streptomyces pinistramenti]